jgi:hypothetical protein
VQRRGFLSAFNFGEYSMGCTRHIFRESYCRKCRRFRGFVCALCGLESDVNVNDPYSRPVPDGSRCTCDETHPQESSVAAKQNSVSSEQIAARRARRRILSVAPENQGDVTKTPADSGEVVPTESAPLWGISGKQWAILVILGSGVVLAFLVMFLITVSTRP